MSALLGRRFLLKASFYRAVSINMPSSGTAKHHHNIHDEVSECDETWPIDDMYDAEWASHVPVAPEDTPETPAALPKEQECQPKAACGVAEGREGAGATEGCNQTSGSTRHWFQYKDLHPDDRHWWWNSRNNDWFYEEANEEDGAEGWKKFTDPTLNAVFWWRGDGGEDWFFAGTGSQTAPSLR